MFALGLEVVDALKQIDEGLVSLIRLLDVPPRGLSFEFCLPSLQKNDPRGNKIGGAQKQQEWLSLNRPQWPG